MKNIFISSTFRDMQAERDLVQERVLPALRAEARKYGDNVGAIDLRWGVDTSTLETDEGSAKVLKVCLDEIERSHPYMLIFLGERYGWIPRKDLLEQAIRNREDKYVTDDFEKSVTALEIEYGALSEQYGELNHCVVCFRDPVSGLMDKETAAEYTEREEKGVQKLRALKERIRRDLGADDRLVTYSCRWDESARTLKSFMVGNTPLEEVLIKYFMEMFRDDWKEYESLSWQEKEQLGFRALMESKLRSFVGREELLETYYKKIVSGTKPLILQGEVGSGKTALMSKLAERLQKEGKNVCPLFCGVGSMSTSAELLVRQMVYYVETLLREEHYETREKSPESRSVEQKAESKYDKWLERLNVLCSKLQEKVYFFVDALDQLVFDEHVEKMDFLIEDRNVQLVLSCTDALELAPVSLLQTERECIPVLKEEDARNVIRGILDADSRESYGELEQELLKKKSIGNPLYISLLIQRLNMMDQEELLQVHTGEEIAAYSLEVIRSMPETLNEAAITILQNAVDKVNGTDSGVLTETIRFLAVSRTGLRAEDLQKLFEARQQNFPVLDFTLLLRYLDTFFYIGEHDRVDFNHKAIRQGVLEKFAEKSRYEEEIKAYVETLDELDDFRMQEGMYYARITKDYELARMLIEQAYHKPSECIMKAVKEQAISDEGTFYCQMLCRENREDSAVIDFFQRRLLDQLDLSQNEMKSRRHLAEALVHCGEELYAKCRNGSSLRILLAGYDHIGQALLYVGDSEAALTYHKKGLAYLEELYDMQESLSGLQDLSTSYNNVGCALLGMERYEDALENYEKARYYGEKMYEEEKSILNLRNLSTVYSNMSHVLRNLGSYEEALEHCEKNLECSKELYDGQNISDLWNLFISYANMGHVLSSMGYYEKALLYDEEALHCAEELHVKKKSMSSLRDLMISHNNMGYALWEMEQYGEAFTHYETALHYGEELHGGQKSMSSLRELAMNYKNMGDVLRDMDCLEQAFTQYDNMLECLEELYCEQEDESSLWKLQQLYGDIAEMAMELGYSEKARLYFEKSLGLE